MNRVDRLFKQLRREGRCGLIAYVTCGDPNPAATPGIVEALVAAGADAIELGVPFSDPIADGPVIQAASQRALAQGTTTADAFAIARAIRATSEVPLIAFSYLNPVLRYGRERFAADAVAAGIDGVLLTDLPPESADATFRKAGLATIFLMAPTSSDKRIAAIERASDPFIYYVSTTGRHRRPERVRSRPPGRLDEVCSKVRKPIAVGFGISRPEHYEALRTRCDALAVGSAIVRAIGAGGAEGAGEVVRGDRG